MKIEIKPYDDSFVAVSFPEGFNTDLLNSVRKIPKRIWNNDEKIWLVPNTQETLDQLKMNVYNTGLFNVNDEIPTKFLMKNKHHSCLKIQQGVCLKS